MKKSFWLAVLAYLVPSFALGYLWHLVALHDAYERLDLYRQDVVIPMGLGSMLIQAFFFAWAYPRLYSTQRQDWIGSAWRFFGTFAMLSWSFTTLPVAAKYQMTSIADFFKLETAYTIIQFAIISPLIAVTYRGTSAQPVTTRKLAGESPRA